MLKFDFVENGNSTYRILCLGAHCDDIEIGCSGTILRLLESRRNVEVYWVVFSSNTERAKEAMSSANMLLEKTKDKKIRIENFRDSFFPFVGNDIKEAFEQIKQEYSPDIVFTHYKNDFHQDHRFISDLTWNTFRDHLILEYEIPKYDGDLGSTNFFVHLDESICHKKINIILESFKSQNHNHWFSKEIFLSMMTLRGIESNSPSRYAEGFYCRKLIF